MLVRVFRTHTWSSIERRSPGLSGSSLTGSFADLRGYDFEEMIDWGAPDVAARSCVFLSSLTTILDFGRTCNCLLRGFRFPRSYTKSAGTLSPASYCSISSAHAWRTPSRISPDQSFSFRTAGSWTPRSEQQRISESDMMSL